MKKNLLPILLGLLLIAGCSDNSPSANQTTPSSLMSQINHGMTLAEVEQIVGSPGVPSPQDRRAYVFTKDGEQILVRIHGDHVDTIEAISQ